MRTRFTGLAVAIAAVLALGVSAALGTPRDAGGWTSRDAMHASEQMRAMRTQMPADAQAECGRMHAQMSSDMGSMTGQMHGGGGMGEMHGQGR